MTYQFEPYNPQMLAKAVRTGDIYSFSLMTADPEDLGVFGLDDQAQLRDGGRFDLTPWAALPSRGLLAGAPRNGQEILQDASGVARYLYIQLNQGAGPAGAGEISATFNPASGPTLRTVQVKPVAP